MMPAVFYLQRSCRKLFVLAVAVVLYVSGPALVHASGPPPTPAIVAGNCAASYTANGSPGNFDLVLATQDTTPESNYWYDDQYSVTAGTEFFPPSTTGQTVSFTTICVGDDVRWEEPNSQFAQSHSSTQGPTPHISDCSGSHAENPLWDIIDCVANPSNNLLAVNVIYCPPAGTCPSGGGANPFFTTQGIFPYYCRAHGGAMTGFVIVNPYATTVAVSGGSPGVYGTTENFTVTVSPSPSRGGAPSSGAVFLFINGQVFNGQTISSISVSGNVATLNTSGTLNANLSAGAQIAIAGTSDSSFAGTFTIASVNAGTNQITYNFTHTNASTTGGVVGLASSGSVTSGTASFSVPSLPAGTDSITAQYSGDANKYAESLVSSPPHPVTITPASASVSLISSQNPAAPGANVTFTATVTNNSTAVAPGASETVQILDGATVLGDMAFQSSIGNQGTYTFLTNTLSAGSHNISAMLQQGNFNSVNQPLTGGPELIEDFTMAISNPAGNAAPCPAGPPCAAGKFWTYNGTLTSVGNYSGNVAISCLAGHPSSCTPGSTPVHVAAGAINVPFTVTASNTAAGTFNFSIQGQDSTAGITHTVPVTLNVSSFTLTAPSPNTATVAAGNPSSLISFGLQAQGAADVATTSCTAAAGITCRFSNGAATQVLQLPLGQNVDGDFTINVASTVAAGTYTVTLKATDQNGVVNTGPVTVTVTVPATAVVFNASFLTPAPASTVPGMVGGYTFNPRASVAFASPSGVTSAIMLITFDQPVFIMSTTNPGTCTIDNANSTVSCNLGSIAVGGGFNTKITVQPAFGVRNITLVNQLACAEKNTGTNLATATVPIRPRPEVHNNIPAR